MKTPDRRVLRTKKLITDAFLNLLMEKKYNDITIQEITDTANVGRATFYLHYGSKEECLMQMLTLGFDSLVNEIEGTLNDADRDFISIVEQIFIHNANHRKLYLALWSDAQSVNILTDVQNYIRTKMLLNVPAPEGFNPVIHQAIATYLTGALLTMLMWWLQEEQSLPPREAAALFVEISQHGIYQLR